MMAAAANGDELQPRRKQLEELREEDLLELIRDTVEQLNNLGDKLEEHARRKTTSVDKEDPGAG